MKKNYFLAKAFAVAAVVGLSSSANAQFFSEDFEGALDTATALPAGWTEQGLSTDGIWAVDNETNASSQYYTFNAPVSGTVFAYTNDDACNCDKSADLMIMPVQNFAANLNGEATITLGFDQHFGGEYGGIATIEVSTDTGNTWTTAATLPAVAGWSQQTVDLGAYILETQVWIAFKYNDAADWAAGFGVDNVTLTASSCVTNTGITADLTEYTQYPLMHQENIITNATVENLGSDTVTNVNVTVNVYDLATMNLEHTEMSTAVASMMPTASEVFAFATGFTPSMVGDYVVEYITMKDQTDCVMDNDTTVQIVQVTDSVYARDAADLGQTLGTAGLGTGQGGELGQAYELMVDDTLTAVRVFISNQDGALNGEQLTINIYDFVGGQPTTLLATTMTPVLDTSNTNMIHECMLTQSLPLTGGSMFFISVVEGASSIQMGTTTNNYTNGPIMVNATGFTTGFVEQSTVYAGPFVFVLRGVFGTPTTSLVGVKEIAEAQFEVMPNPAVDNIMVKNVAGSTVEIFNNLGQAVYRTVATSTNINVNVANFDNGIYTIKVTNEENVSTQSFVKQ